MEFRGVFWVALALVLFGGCSGLLFRPDWSNEGKLRDYAMENTKPQYESKTYSFACETKVWRWSQGDDEVDSDAERRPLSKREEFQILQDEVVHRVKWAFSAVAALPEKVLGSETTVADGLITGISGGITYYKMVHHAAPRHKLLYIVPIMLLPFTVGFAFGYDVAPTCEALSTELNDVNYWKKYHEFRRSEQSKPAGGWLSG